MFVVIIFILNIFVCRRVNPRIHDKIIASKFIIGMVLAATSMLITGVVEIERQNHNPSMSMAHSISD